MARFKVTPTNVVTGVTAPSSIHEFDENKDLEVQAEKACHLTSRFPRIWMASITKLKPCKIDMRE